jgi:hypothetical protein
MPASGYPYFDTPYEVVENGRCRIFQSRFTKNLGAGTMTTGTVFCVIGRYIGA